MNDIQDPTLKPINQSSSIGSEQPPAAPQQAINTQGEQSAVTPEQVPQQPVQEESQPISFTDFTDDELSQVMDIAAQNNDLDSLGLMMSEYDARQAKAARLEAKQASVNETASLMDKASDMVNDFLDGLAKAKEQVHGKHHTFSGAYESQALAAQQPAIKKGEPVPEKYQTYDQAKLSQADAILADIDNNPDYKGMSRDEIYNSLRGQDAIEVTAATATAPIAPTSLAGSVATGAAIAAGTEAAKDLTKDNADINTGSIAWDAATGALGGAVGYGLGATLGKVVDKITPNTSATKARNLIRKEIKDSDINPDDLRNELLQIAEGDKSGLGVTLADSKQMDKVINNLTQGKPVDNKIIDALTERAKLQSEALTKGDAVQPVNIGLDGSERAFKQGELLNDGSVNVAATTANLTDELNQATKPLYEAAYKTEIKPSMFNLELRNKPAFISAYKAAQKTAQNKGSVSDFEVMDLTKRELDMQIANSTGADKVGLMKQRDELTKNLTDISPDYKKALEVQSSYRNDVIEQMKKGQKFLGMKPEQAAITLESMASGNTDAALTGLRSALKAQVNKGVRNKQTGSLLSKQQTENLDKLLDLTPDQQTKLLKSTIGTEAAFTRTANLKAIKENGTSKSLGIIQAATGDKFTALSVFAAFTDPSLFSLGSAAIRVTAKMSKTKMYNESIKQVQNELYKTLGSKAEAKAAIDNLLALDFEKVPSDVLKTLGSKLSQGYLITDE